jgi:hypothetical protein
MCVGDLGHNMNGLPGFDEGQLLAHPDGGQNQLSQ